LKKISLIILLSFILLSQIGNAQVGDIKSASGGNSAGGFLSDGDVGDGSLLGLCCSDLFLDFFIEVLIIGGFELHELHMEKSYDIPRVTSLEFMPQFAFHAPSTYQVLPRIRGNYGLFSTDFRYNFMLETSSLNSADFYKTFDWQIIELNLILTESFNFRIGSGFMFEDYSEKFYNENTAALDYYFKNDVFKIGSEFRYAVDYDTDAVPRTEGSIGLDFRFFEMNTVSGYFNLGGMYQNYYHKVDVWSLMGGLNFRFQ